MDKYTVLMTLLLMVCVDVTNSSQPSVTVNGSVVYGVNTQVEDVTVEQYLGIQFALPPTGSRRFQKPQAAPLPAVLNATKLGNSCWGRLGNSLPMDEDCLFLNVFVPRRGDGNTAMPVMFWIHGGAFVQGSATNYDGSVLAAEGNVIVVAPNYRLGPFGFLSTGDNSCRGNFGLWDQWLALKWVKDNIQAYGGDVNNITLFGESAGAASVNFHMTSPYSVTMFQRAILQSGCRLCSWANNATSHPIALANNMAASLLCPTATLGDPESTQRMMTCLREKQSDAIDSAGSVIAEWSPVPDGDFVLPYETTSKFTGQVMAGINNNEGGLFLSLSRLWLGQALNVRSFYRQQMLNETLTQAFPSLTTSAGPRNMEVALDVVDRVYREENSTDVMVTDGELAAFFGDSLIVVCTLQLLATEPTTSSVYLYYFDHYPDIPGGENGMDHTWDVDYTFGFNRGLRAAVSPFSNVNLSQTDLDLAVSFRSLLTNFAKTGIPNQPANWPAWLPYTKGEQSYLSVSSNPRVASHVKKATMMVWREIIPTILRSQGASRLDNTENSQCLDTSTGSAGSNAVSKYILSLCVTLMLGFVLTV